MPEETLKNSAEFLKQISSYSEQMKTNFKDVYSAVDDLKSKIGTELFDPSDAQQYLNAIKDLEDEMTQFASSISGLLSKTIIKDFDIMIKKVNNIRSIIGEDLQFTIDTSIVTGFANQIESASTNIILAVNKLKEQTGTDLFDPSDVQQGLEIFTNLKEQITDILTSSSAGFSSVMIDDLNKMLATVIEVGESFGTIVAESSKIDENIKTIKQPFEDMFTSFTDSAKKIPFVGDFIYQSMGINDIKQKLTTNLKTAFSTVGTDGKISASAISGAFISTFSAMAKTISSMLRTIFLNPWLLAVVGIALLIKKFVSLENAAEDFRKTTGLSYDSSKKLTSELERSALSARMFGVEMEDIFASASALVKQFGSSKLITSGIARDLAVLSKTTGITEENAAGVYRQFSATNDATSKSAVDMSDTLAYVSQLMGVPMDEMFADVAGSGEFISTYMGKTGDALIKAATQARLLGLNMKDVESMMSNIMDFEGSIEKELMASILVGKQLNFNYARQLAFNGLIAEATEEVMRQVGSLEEFNRLNPIAAKAMADAAGLTVEALRNSLQTQDLINKAHGQEKKDLIAARDLIEGRNNLSDDERKAMQKAAIMNQGALTQMKNVWGQIGASITKLVLPAIELMSVVLKGIADGVLWIFGGIDSLGGGTDSWVSKLLKGVLVIGAIIGALIGVKLILGSISLLTGKILGGGAAGGVAKGGGLMGKIFGGMSPTSMLSGAASILIISAAIWVFGKALQEIDKVKDIGTTLIAAVVGLAALAGVAMILGTISGPILAGSFAILVLSGALWVLGKAVNEFVPMVDTLLKGIAVITDIIGKTIVNIINAVADSLVKIGSINAINLIGVASAVGLLGVSLAAFGTGSIFAGIGSFLGGDSFVDKLVKISELGPGLIAAALGLGAITAASQGTPVDFATLHAVPEAINLPVNTSATLKDTIATGDNLIIEKLNQLIDVVNKNDIYLDNRKVNTNLGRNLYGSKLT